jgi:SAM-dependent methyltransferase
MTVGATFSPVVERFRSAYAEQRASEGRGYSGSELRRLPYLRSGPLSKQWQVRARTFDAFIALVVRPRSVEAGDLRVLDLGAGNGWLSYRLAKMGHECVAIDLRDDTVDGLGAAAELARESPFDRVVASFDRLPHHDREADVTVFNASLHYATDLSKALAEAARVTRAGGCIAVLDSPFYRAEADGHAMVEEKHKTATTNFAGRAADLLALHAIEFLTHKRLIDASQQLGLVWRRNRVRYPLWYELRPLIAIFHGRRAPSRFDLWTASVP